MCKIGFLFGDPSGFEIFQLFRGARGKADSSIVLPISVEEMARIGIPARKIPRVREELQRLIAADPALRDRKKVLQLARQIAAEIL